MNFSKSEYTSIIVCSLKAVLMNRPVACKDLGMQLEIIAHDVTTRCSGCLH